MSGIVGVFSARATDSALAGTMLASGQRGAAEHSAVRHERGSFVGVTRYDWELGQDFSGPVLLADDAEFTIAADASLYYRDDLRAALAAAGVRPTGNTPSHLILAAYRAWGAGCVDRLEGDYAFVIWNRVSNEVFAARDFVGRRPLYFAELSGTLVVASTVGAVRTHPSCSSELNPAAIGGLASGLLWSAGLDTCFRDVQVLQAAHRLSWRPGVAIRTERFWEPHVRTNAPVAGFDDAAQELRSLLMRATTERMAASDPTALWMSGGWDSTAVFGAGKAAIRANTGSTQSLLPVSISYPAGDPGHEDHFIKSVAEHWQSPVHWLQIGDIRLLTRVEEQATRTDQPPAHMYEPINLALAAAARTHGARVCLDGNGGDQLFQVTDIYMSDLLKQGRLRELRRDWKLKQTWGRRYLLRMTLEPLLPSFLARAIAPITRSGGTHYLERQVPSWFDQGWMEAQGVVERDRAVLPPRAWRRTDAESRFFFTAPYWGMMLGYMNERLLQAGVESRGPLVDRRIVEFGLRRPPEERSAGLDIKLLPRRAMAGLLPENVLASRPYKTGLSVGYSRSEMRSALPALAERMLAQPLMLADLGAVDASRFRDAVERYNAGNESDRMTLYTTLNTELWLRQVHTSRSSEVPVEPEVLSATA